MKAIVAPLVLISLFLAGCGTSGPGALFRKLSPHEQYAQTLNNAGLQHTALGKAWAMAAESSLRRPLSIKIPFKESGYFPAEDARATAYRFRAQRGEKLSISLEKRPTTEYHLYADLWKEGEQGETRLEASADTGSSSFDYTVREEAFYILRVQPELLRSCEYTLTILSGPSLAFPVKGGKILSFWGAERDQGSRSHEGIDIFAARRTPALAAADGVITRVGENTLGGKVIFMRPKNESYNLYYAHLDEFSKAEGSSVLEGDTLGLVGNTGNARGGSPHLHFGIYARNGAVDPLPFVNPERKMPAEIRANQQYLQQRMRSSAKTQVLRTGPGLNFPPVKTIAPGTLAQVTGISASYFRIYLPDGEQGYIAKEALQTLGKPTRSLTLAVAKELYDTPDVLAARKQLLPAASTVDILANFENYQYVRSRTTTGWIVKEL